MANTNNTNDYLANYIIAVNENNYDDVIKVSVLLMIDSKVFNIFILLDFESKIKNTPSNNKTELIAFLTIEQRLFFELKIIKVRKLNIHVNI